jgi:hypothetical protein
VLLYCLCSHVALLVFDPQSAACCCELDDIWIIRTTTLYFFSLHFELWLNPQKTRFCNAILLHVIKNTLFVCPYFSEQKCIKSQKYAAENGLPILKYVLLPKTKGFSFCIEELRSSLDAG